VNPSSAVDPVSLSSAEPNIEANGMAAAGCDWLEDPFVPTFGIGGPTVTVGLDPAELGVEYAGVSAASLDTVGR